MLAYATINQVCCWHSKVQLTSNIITAVYHHCALNMPSCGIGANRHPAEAARHLHNNGTHLCMHIHYYNTTELPEKMGLTT
jgi:hypothetical protein